MRCPVHHPSFPRGAGWADVHHTWKNSAILKLCKWDTELLQIRSDLWTWTDKNKTLRYKSRNQFLPCYVWITPGKPVWLGRGGRKARTVWSDHRGRWGQAGKDSEEPSSALTTDLQTLCFRSSPALRKFSASACQAPVLSWLTLRIRFLDLTNSGGFLLPPGSNRAPHMLVPASLCSLAGHRCPSHALFHVAFHRCPCLLHHLDVVFLSHFITCNHCL